MAKSKTKRRRAPKSVLKLPDLEQSKSAVLNSLTSPSSQRTYDHAIREFIEWYCSEPRLAFNKTVVTRYRIYLEQQRYASTTIHLRLAAVRRLAGSFGDGPANTPRPANTPQIRANTQRPGQPSGTSPCFPLSRIPQIHPHVTPLLGSLLGYRTRRSGQSARRDVCRPIRSSSPIARVP